MRTVKTDQTGRMPRLILVFAGRTLTLLVLSEGGSFPVIQVPFTPDTSLFSELILSLWIKSLSSEMSKIFILSFSRSELVDFILGSLFVFLKYFSRNVESSKWSTFTSACSNPSCKWQNIKFSILQEKLLSSWQSKPWLKTNFLVV